MNIPAVSKLMSLWAVNSVTNTKKTSEHNQSFLIQEEPPSASKQVSRNADESQSGCIQGATMTEDDHHRYIDYRARVPSMIGKITIQGEWNDNAYKQRLELTQITYRHFSEVREEFGYTTSDYMPYFRDYPEYDPTIEKAMQDTLYKMVADDPVSQILIKSIGAIFPPPDHLDFSTMVSGNFRDIKEVMAETRRVLQISEPERLGNINNSSQNEKKKMDFYA